MHSFVVRVALRQHVPLRACVENPQDCFKNATCRDGFASGTTIGNVLLRKMHPDQLPVGEARVLKHFQARMPYSLFVPDAS